MLLVELNERLERGFIFSSHGLLCETGSEFNKTPAVMAEGEVPKNRARFKHHVVRLEKKK